jgi:protein TonB
MKKHFLFLIFLIISNTYSQELKIDEKAFSITEVDEKPHYKGGVEKFYSYVAKKFRAPEEPGLKGKIIVEFIIEKDGSISNFTVIQDIGYGTAEEVARVFKDCPKWQPGKKDGQTVRTLYRFPITIMSAS